ncbi:hypothetical protein QBC42DRAFT_205280 [Cladorrhinum samala]|uniref:Uncharacterized protein n=1 Tax=Cladorrhinum samala TaxID=585594 RepID=A0AAV9HKW1_9PEZI|nr:hypothetical protein QBC42DRAFT_205280 [Cladorrhinum samala]
MAGLAASRHAPASSSPSSSTSQRPPSQPAAAAAAGIAKNPDKSEPNAAADVPSAPAPSPPSNGRQPAAASELSRFKKIIHRLQWKTQFLDAGYRLAVDRLGKPAPDAAAREMMFKLDFFEYYMLIERALVHLLGVFGMSVVSSSSSSSSTSGPGARAAEIAPGKRNGKGLGKSRWGKKTTSSDAARGGGSNHRYHATVLEMLDSPSNPLHQVLGKGEVRRQLGRAKDLRNRWKTADCDNDAEDGQEEGGGGGGGGGGRKKGQQGMRNKKSPAPLESYDLANMLREISNGFGKGFEVAEGYVSGLMLLGGREEDTVMDWSEEVEMEEQRSGEDISSWQVGMDEGWEFMVDAMDWEAV